MQNHLLPARLRCLHSLWLDQRMVRQTVWDANPSLRQLHHYLFGFAAAAVGAAVHAVATGTSEAAAAVHAQGQHHD